MKMKKTKSSIPLTGTVSNTTYTNTFNPNTITSTTTGTTINTTISPNYSNLTFQPTPFNIKFNWGGKEVNISLKSGNDIFKLANMFMKMLDSEDIDYNIETNKKRR